jgi:uncharacterized RDD family membrane protein YckC
MSAIRFLGEGQIRSQHLFQDFQTPSYAGFWLRFAAYLIDAILLGLVLVPLGFILGVLLIATDNVNNQDLALLVNMLSNVISLVVDWLYASLLESSPWQATVGKKLIGIRVTDMNGNRIGFGQATGRHFGKILSSLICLIGFIMAAFTEKQQALHDMLAGTLVLSGSSESVVYNPPPPPDFYGGAFTGR